MGYASVLRGLLVLALWYFSVFGVQSQNIEDSHIETESQKTVLSSPNYSNEQAKKALYKLGYKPNSIITYYFEEAAPEKLALVLDPLALSLNGKPLNYGMSERNLSVKELPNNNSNKVKEEVTFQVEQYALLIIPASHTQDAQKKLDALPYRLIKKMFSMADFDWVAQNELNDSEDSDESKKQGLLIEKAVKEILKEKGLAPDKEWSFIEVRAQSLLRKRITLRDNYNKNDEAKVPPMGRKAQQAMAFLFGLGLGASVIYLYLRNR